MKVSLNSFIKRHKPLCIIFMKSWNMAQKFLHWEIFKDRRQINITTIISYLKIRLILHSSMYYFSPKKSNCNYQGLQHYSSFQKGLSTVSSFKFNFTFCIAVLSFRHGLQVHQVASKRLKTKGWISWKGWNWTVLASILLFTCF